MGSRWYVVTLWLAVACSGVCHGMLVGFPWYAAEFADCLEAAVACHGHGHSMPFKLSWQLPWLSKAVVPWFAVANAMGCRGMRWPANESHSIVLQGLAMGTTSHGMPQKVK